MSRCNYLQTSQTHETDFHSPKIDDDLHKLETLLKTMRQIDIIHSLIEQYPNDFGAIYTSDDILRVFKSGKIASLIGIEGLHQIGGSATCVRLFHRLGVRYITLCHDDDNEYADSAVYDFLPCNTSTSVLTFRDRLASHSLMEGYQTKART